MLSDARIARIALLLSVVGLFLLFFLEQLPAKKTVSEALLAEKDSLIEITARVAWAKQSGKMLLFELGDKNRISAVMFNPGSKETELLKPKSNVTAIGTLADSAGKKQFVVREVKAVD